MVHHILKALEKSISNRSDIWRLLRDSKMEFYAFSKACSQLLPSRKLYCSSNSESLLISLKKFQNLTVHKLFVYL